MADAGGSEAEQTALLTSESDASGGAQASHYRPQLDGMRAVAVYLVVAFHAGVSAFSGGFIGVDVFFVLSGYLVTQLLLRDFRSRGRIDFRRFYSRRFRRLLPAAFVTLVVTAVVYTAVAAPADVHDAIGGFRSAFLYVANWHFISQSNDYFAADVNSNPVVHFWSLAVEEQFYLFWPLLLSGVYLVSRRAGARQWKVVRLIIAAGFALSLGAALHLSTVNLSRAYYGTDTRAYELLAGALLAITPWVMRCARERRRLVRVLAPFELAALIVIATSTVHLGAIQRGVAATIATCGLIVALEVSKGGLVTRVLSIPSAVYLGRVSYGTYLWHWPVIVIATQRFHPTPVALFALTCLVGTALASLSFEMLEQPVRLSRLLDRHRSQVIAVGLAVSIVGGLVIVPGIMRHDQSTANSTAVLGDAAGGGDLRVRVPPIDLNAIESQSYGTKTCFRKPTSDCIVVRGSGKRILLVGDSHAVSLVPAFATIARNHGLTFALASFPSCPWPRGLVEAPAGSQPGLPSACQARQDDWYDRLVPQFHPDVIVLLHHPFDDPGGGPDMRANGKLIHFGTEEFSAAIRTASQRTIAALQANGRKIVIIEPLPLAPHGFNPLTCLSQAKFVDDCRYVAASPTPIERFYRSLADGSSTFTLDLDRVVCPYYPICDPVVRGVVVKRDSQHITAEYSQKIAPSIGAILVADGILQRVR
jgi:peptidoglycan/LPS O-acetylase OafA/YrhL